MFVHNVFFKLTPEAAKHPEAFLCGLRKMAVITDLRQFLIGRPAGTNRPVVLNDYDYSLHVAFDDHAGHDRYQVDPIHLEFVDTCKQHWCGVRIFDTVTV